MTGSPADRLTYIMPIRSAAPRDDLAMYLRWLVERADTIVVDGSPAAIFAAHAAAWTEALHAGLHHVPPAAELTTEMGKVGGVLTGLRLASHPRVIIADDDVRYDEAALAPQREQANAGMVQQSRFDESRILPALVRRDVRVLIEHENHLELRLTAQRLSQRRHLHHLVEQSVHGVAGSLIRRRGVVSAICRAAGE